MTSTSVKDFSGMMPNLNAVYEKLEQQEKWKRWLGGCLLLVSAVIALTYGPTEAIVVASLALAAINLFPPLRRVIRGDVIALRDARGKTRIVIGVSDEGQPRIVLLDRNDEPRLALLLDEDDSPILFMVDEEEDRVLTVSNTSQGAGLSVNASSSDSGLVLAVGLGTEEGDAGEEEVELATLMVSDNHGSNLAVMPGVMKVSTDERRVYVATLDAITVQCESGGNAAGIEVASDHAGVMARTTSARTLMRADAEQALCQLKHEEGTGLVRASAVRSTGEVSVRSDDGEMVSWPPPVGPATQTSTSDSE